jgi:hypothetical protein
MEPPLLPSGPPYTFVIGGTERGHLTVLEPDPGGSLAAARSPLTGHPLGMLPDSRLCRDRTLCDAFGPVAWIPAP